MDPISDMIIRIKNANKAGKTAVVVPYSKMKFEIANILSKNGFVGAVAKKGRKVRKIIEIQLAYRGKQPIIQNIRRISKLSKRIYVGFKKIPFYCNTGSTVVLSSPKGLITAREAIKDKVGGEVLFKIW